MMLVQCLLLLTWLCVVLFTGLWLNLNLSQHRDVRRLHSSAGKRQQNKKLFFQCGVSCVEAGWDVHSLLNCSNLSVTSCFQLPPPQLGSFSISHQQKPLFGVCSGAADARSTKSLIHSTKKTRAELQQHKTPMDSFTHGILLFLMSQSVYTKLFLKFKDQTRFWWTGPRCGSQKFWMSSHWRTNNFSPAWAKNHKIHFVQLIYVCWQVFKNVSVVKSLCPSPLIRQLESRTPLGQLCFSGRGSESGKPFRIRRWCER